MSVDRDLTAGAQGVGLRVRLKAVRGLTPRDLLREPLRIPCVVGETFEFTQEGMHANFDTVAAGEFSQPAGGKHSRRLKTMSLDALAMVWDPVWMTFPGTSPQRARRVLMALAERKAAFHFLAIVGPPNVRAPDRPELSCLATVRAITPRLRRGETDSRYFALDFSEYREPGVRRRHGGHGRHHLPAKHTLRHDDTFRHLARHYYGKPELWRHIARHNGVKHWGSEDPIVHMKRFRVGDRITIPKQPHGHHHHGPHHSGGVGMPKRDTDDDAGLYLVGDEEF